jgi:hypothetical protein
MALPSPFQTITLNILQYIPYSESENIQLKTKKIRRESLTRTTNQFFQNVVILDLNHQKYEPLTLQQSIENTLFLLISQAKLKLIC